MDQDLMLAILAMDAYSRGYGQAINLNGSAVDSSVI